MKFWDSSALVSVCLEDPRSSAVRSVLVNDPSVVVWWLTRTECVSALVRRVREGRLSVEEERQARRVVETLAESWIEIEPSETLRLSAERLLGVHPLRAADAFQLAAALLWCQGQPRGMELVSFDARLREAGYREGFALLPGEQA